MLNKILIAVLYSITFSKLCCVSRTENQNSRQASGSMARISNKADLDPITPFSMVAQQPGLQKIPNEIMQIILGHAYPKLRAYNLQVTGATICTNLTFPASVILPLNELSNIIESQKVDSNIPINISGIIKQLEKQVLYDKLRPCADYNRSWTIKFSPDGKQYINLDFQYIIKRKNRENRLGLRLGVGVAFSF